MVSLAAGAPVNVQLCFVLGWEDGGGRKRARRVPLALTFTFTLSRLPFLYALCMYLYAGNFLWCLCARVRPLPHFTRARLYRGEGGQIRLTEHQTVSWPPVCSFAPNCVLSLDGRGRSVIAPALPVTRSPASNPFSNDACKGYELTIKYRN